MKLYAELPGYRSRQLLGDLLVVAWICLWTWAGLEVHDLIIALDDPARAVERAGDDLSAGARRAGAEASELPVVGEALRGPFEAIAGAGTELAEAGSRQRKAVGSLARWLALAVAGGPAVVILAGYLPGRIRWIAEATAAHHLRTRAEDRHLLALRAAVNRPLRELRRVSPDPAGDIRAGRYEALARLELRALGLKLEQSKRM